MTKILWRIAILTSYLELIDNSRPEQRRELQLYILRLAYEMGRDDEWDRHMRPVFEQLANLRPADTIATVAA